MIKAEHTLELLVHIPLVTQCVFYHPQLKKLGGSALPSGSSFLICVVYIVCRRVAERLLMLKGKEVKSSECGLEMMMMIIIIMTMMTMMMLGVLGADNKLIFIGTGL
jgi:hypothetical protein